MAYRLLVMHVDNLTMNKQTLLDIKLVDYQQVLSRPSSLQLRDVCLHLPFFFLVKFELCLISFIKNII